MKSLLFAVGMGALTLTSCSDTATNNLIEIPEKEVFTTVINAATPGDQETRVGFEDGGSNGVSLTWDADDVLVAYQNGTKAAVFSYTGTPGATSGSFTAETNHELIGDFTLIYTTLSDHKTNLDDMRSAIKSVSVSQSGNASTEHLKHSVWMEVGYNPATAGDVVFVQQMALLTVVMDKPDNVQGNPISLKVANGDGQYTMSLRGLTWDEAVKAYLFVDENRTAGRQFSFEVVTDAAKFYAYSTTTNTAHLAQNRYTAALSGNRVLVETDSYSGIYELNNFPAIIPEDNLWVITASYFAHSQDNWKNLMDCMEQADYLNRKINLVFPELQAIPNSIFQNCQSLETIYAPSSMDNYASNTFENCQSLIYANLGFTSYLSDNMFKDCIKLESLILPFISGVGATVFENCISLTLLDLGSDKNSSLGNI